MEIICMVENVEAIERIFFLHIFMENIVTVDFFKKLLLMWLLGHNLMCF